MPSIILGSRFEFALTSGAKKGHIIRRRKRAQDRIASMSSVTIYVSRAKRKIVRIIDTVCSSARPIFRVRPGSWAYNDAGVDLPLSKNDLNLLALEMGFPTAEEMDEYYTKEFKTEVLTGLDLVRWK